MVNLVSDAPNTNSRTNITCETKGLPRNVLGLYKFRVLRDQGKIRIKIPKIPVKKACKTQKQDVENGDRNLKMRTEKEKGDWFRPGKRFQIKKVSSVISGVFSHKKTQTDGDCDQSDDSRKMVSAKADQTLAIVNVNTDKKPSKMTKSLREIRRVSSSIMILGQRLKMRSMRENSEKVRKHTMRQVDGEDRVGEEELCKKRILMGGKCKPLNQSGKLQYDGEGILLPEP